MKEMFKMAKSFNESAGGAQKNSLEYIKFGMGVNRMRIVGPILPRYSYWKKLGENNIPVECLAFDREAERFLNTEKDWFKQYFPKDDRGEETRCVWSYVGTAIDPQDGKLKMVGFKKKLFEQIQALAAKPGFGDPTDVKTGWDVVFSKNKTGPHAFNVEYVLDALECKESIRPLTEEELELVKDLKPIDELVPRQTAEQQKAFIENAWFSNDEENVDDAATDALDTDSEKEDVPF